jgi:starvation-inducible DNA-binding protein
MAKANNVTSALANVLADTYTLYLKTQNYHWNVTGAQFYSLHGMFESQYKALAEANDEIAERIRALGEAAPGSFKDFSARTSLKEAKAETLSGAKMVETLAADHKAVSNSLTEALELAQAAGDEATADLLIGRIEAHDKFAWMLKSSIKG